MTILKEFSLCLTACCCCCLFNVIGPQIQRRCHHQRESSASRRWSEGQCCSSSGTREDSLQLQTRRLWDLYGKHEWPQSESLSNVHSSGKMCNQYYLILDEGHKLQMLFSFKIFHFAQISLYCLNLD